MTSLFRKIFDIRPGEGVRASLMFAYIFLIIASLTIVKPVRISLFLSEFGPEQLPYGFMLVAVVSPILVGLYTKLARVVRLNRLIAATTVGSIASLLMVSLLLSLGFREVWFIYAFYVWVAIFGLLTTAQFWLLASYVFNAREAKRLFSFIGSGAIAGGIFGGYLTSVLAPLLNTRGMLHFCYVFLAGCLIIQYYIWKNGARATYQERLRRQDRQRELQQQSSPLRLLLKSRLVIFSAAIVGVSVVIGTLVDFQFSALASDRIDDPDELTAFFGFWLSNVSVLSLLIQIVVTNYALKRVGVAGALMVLPIVAAAGASAVIFAPLLLTTTALKVSEGGVKQSIHKAGIELLGLPVPARLRNQVKALVDVAVDNLATGLTGILILLLTVQIGLDARGISVAILVFSASLFYLVVRGRQDYVDAFRQAIEKRAIRQEDLSYEIFATMRADYLIRLLSSGNERQVVLALGYLENMRDPRLAEHLCALAESTSDDVLLRVFRVGRSFPEIDLCEHAKHRIASGQHNVRVAAMRYLMSCSENKIAMIREWLKSDDVSIKAAAIEAAAREWDFDGDFRKSVDVADLLEPFASGESPTDTSSSEIEMSLARAIGIAPRPQLFSALKELLRSKDATIRSTAALSAGRTRDKRFLNDLIALLEEKHTRRSAREALSEYGGDIAEVLILRFSEPSMPFRVRFEIPRVLSMIGTHESLTALAGQLNQPNVLLRYEVIRSLNKVRTRDPNLRIKSKYIDPVILAEVRRYYEILAVLSQIKEASESAGHGRSELAATRARKFLTRALQERLSAKLDRIFRLLGLKYVPKDMYHAFLGVTSGLPDLRANAVELLDLVLDPKLKPAVLPLAEISEAERQAEIGAKLFRLSVTSEIAGLQVLIEGDDDWLRICALYAGAHIGTVFNEADLTKLESHENYVIRETVGLVRRNKLAMAEL